MSRDILKQIIFIKNKNVKNKQGKVASNSFYSRVSTVVVERHHDFCNIKRNYQDIQGTTQGIHS